MFDIIQPRFIVLQAARYNEYCNGKAEFSETAIDVNEIKSIKPALFDNTCWILEFVRGRDPLILKEFDAKEFLECVAKLEKANCLFGVEPDKNFIWRLKKLDDIKTIEIKQKEINEMPTKTTKSTEKKTKSSATTNVKKDQKTSTSKNTEEIKEKDVSIITKISFFGKPDDSSFVINWSNGNTEVIQNDDTHDKLNNRVKFMNGQGYHVVENKAERSLTFEPDIKPEEMKNTLLDIVVEQMKKSDGKFYYIDFNKLSKGDIKRIANGLDLSPNTPKEMTLFVIGCVLKLMAIGEVAEVTNQPPFIESIRDILDAIKRIDGCISDELETKPTISSTVEEINGLGCRNWNNSRRATQKEKESIRKFVEAIDELINMVNF